LIFVVSCIFIYLRCWLINDKIDLSHRLKKRGYTHIRASRIYARCRAKPMCKLKAAAA
jgi:hypothetical protein